MAQAAAAHKSVTRALLMPQAAEAMASGAMEMNLPNVPGTVDAAPSQPFMYPGAGAPAPFVYPGVGGPAPFVYPGAGQRLVCTFSPLEDLWID